MELTDVLRSGRQCDEDGVEIIMSRQACCEAADELDRLRALTQQQAEQIAELVGYAKGLRKSAQKALNLIPANDGAGGLIYDHHSPDGEYVGTEQVDPMCVINGMDETLNAALAKPMPKAMKDDAQMGCVTMNGIQQD